MAESLIGSLNQFSPACNRYQTYKFKFIVCNPLIKQIYEYRQKIELKCPELQISGQQKLDNLYFLRIARGSRHPRAKDKLP